MSDCIPKANIVTHIKIGDFVINAYAYRRLSRSECEIVAQKYLTEKHLKSFPKSGSVDIHTTFGSNPLDNL